MSSQVNRPAEMVEFAYECSALLLSALYRERPSVIKKDVLKDTYNGQAIQREFTNNFQDPYNLELMDKLLLPLFKDLIKEAEKLGAETAVRMAFGREGLYAIEVLGSVKEKSFHEIREILSLRNQQPVLRLVKS